MRYQLPPGVVAVSVLGVEFQGDDNGTIWVDPEGRQDIHIALQSVHGPHLQLAASQDPPVIPEDDPAPAAPAAPEDAGAGHEGEGTAAVAASEDTRAAAAQAARDLRRELLNELAAYGVRVDRRAGAPYLRELLAQAKARSTEVETAEAAE